VIELLLLKVEFAAAQQAVRLPTTESAVNTKGRARPARKTAMPRG
jgi:hypothetical protein